MSDNPLKSLVIDDTRYETTHTAKYERRRAWKRADPNRLDAHIPGVILKVSVTAGQRVRWGDPVLVLEAMKMRNDVTAPRDGIVKAIHVHPGQLVAKGQLLVELE